MNRSSLSWLLPLLLAGCSLQSVAPEPSFYQFGASRAQPASAVSPRHGVLRVPDCRVAQVNRSASLIYRETDQRFIADPYRLLGAPPATLLAERTRAWLAASGLFQAVAPSNSQLPSTLTLECELLELYVDVRRPQAPAAVLSLRAWLIDADSGLRQPEWRFSRRIPLPAADAPSAIAGFDQALSAALTELENALGK